MPLKLCFSLDVNIFGSFLCQHQFVFSSYFSCVLMNKAAFHCGTFDLDGLATDNSVYPLPWKISKMCIAVGFLIMTLTIFLTAASCCRQSIFGKSIHTITGSAQAIAGNHCWCHTYNEQWLIALIDIWNSYCCVNCIVRAPIWMGTYSCATPLWRGLIGILAIRLHIRCVLLFPFGLFDRVFFFF